MGKLIFINGGARSGKSTYAIELAKRFNKKKVAFIATCLPLDIEMKKRIEAHKRDRPSCWQTFEKPKDIPLLLKKIDSNFGVIIIDCLTLFITNLLLEGLDDKSIEDKVNKILKTFNSLSSELIIISNEVGLGMVPNNQLSRRFRDLAGRVNQIVAQEASDVFFMFSGIPLKVKGD